MAFSWEKEKREEESTMCVNWKKNLPLWEPAKWFACLLFEFLPFSQYFSFCPNSAPAPNLPNRPFAVTGTQCMLSGWWPDAADPPWWLMHRSGEMMMMRLLLTQIWHALMMLGWPAGLTGWTADHPGRQKGLFCIFPPTRRKRTVCCVRVVAVFFFKYQSRALASRIMGGNKNILGLQQKLIRSSFVFRATTMTLGKNGIARVFFAQGQSKKSVDSFWHEFCPSLFCLE